MRPLPDTSPPDSGISSRGELPFAPLIMGHMLCESMGGRPALAALWSVASVTPAKPAKVAYLRPYIQNRATWMGYNDVRSHNSTPGERRREITWNAEQWGWKGGGSWWDWGVERVGDGRAWEGFRVTHQSQMCMKPLMMVLRTPSGRRPPLTNAATRVPPSKSDPLAPLSGQLLAWSAGPPLWEQRW